MLPKEKQTAYQRWEMASFEEKKVAPPPPPSPISAFAEQITAARDEARRKGHEAGYEEGLAKGIEQGLAQGLEEGRRQGLEEGRAQALQEKLRLQELTETFSSEIANANETVADNLLDLALDLAKAMLKTELAVKPELIIPIVSEAIHYLPSVQQPALVYLHPDDAVLVRDMMGDELSASGWRIVEEQTIERGGCRIETASNQIDASVASRWQRIATALGKNTEWIA